MILCRSKSRTCSLRSLAVLALNCALCVAAVEISFTNECFGQSGRSQDLVVSVQSTQSDSYCDEVLTRLRAELRAGGFRIAKGPDQKVLVRIFRAENVLSVEIQMTDNSGELVKRELQISILDTTPSVVAVQSLEALRAMLGYPVGGDTSYSASSTSVQKPVLAAPPKATTSKEIAEGARTTSVEIRLAVLPGLGFPSSFGPQIGVVHPLQPGWQVRGELSYFPWGNDAEADQGAAHLRRLFVQAGVYRLFLSEGALDLSAGALVGTHTLFATGVADAPRVTRDKTLWGVVLGVGGAGRYRLGRHFCASLDAQVFSVLPQPVIRIGTDDSTRGNWVGGMLSLGLGGSF